MEANAGSSPKSSNLFPNFEETLKASAASGGVLLESTSNVRDASPLPSPFSLGFSEALSYANGIISLNYIILFDTRPVLLAPSKIQSSPENESHFSFSSFSVALHLSISSNCPIYLFLLYV
jgi:hypothetical protein